MFKQRVDPRSRAILPAEYAGKIVSIETIGAGEVRIRVVREARSRPALSDLLSKMTDDNRHKAIDFGPLTGEEVL